MARLLTVTILNAIALWLTSRVFGVFSITAFSGGEPYNEVLTFLVLGLFLSVINGLLMPIVKIITLPLYILTLGLWAFIVNGVALWVLKMVSDGIGWGVHIDTFWWQAIWAALILGLVNWVVSALAGALGVSPQQRT